MDAERGEPEQGNLRVSPPPPPAQRREWRRRHSDGGAERTAAAVLLSLLGRGGCDGRPARVSAFASRRPTTVPRSLGPAGLRASQRGSRAREQTRGARVLPRVHTMRRRARTPSSRRGNGTSLRRPDARTRASREPPAESEHQLSNRGEGDGAPLPPGAAAGPGPAPALTCDLLVGDVR